MFMRIQKCTRISSNDLATTRRLQDFVFISLWSMFVDFSAGGGLSINGIFILLYHQFLFSFFFSL